MAEFDIFKEKNFNADRSFYEWLPRCKSVSRLDFIAARSLSTSWDYFSECVRRKLVPDTALHTLLDAVLLDDHVDSSQRFLTLLLEHWPRSFFSLSSIQEGERHSVDDDTSFQNGSARNFVERIFNKKKKQILACLLLLFDRLTSSEAAVPSKILDLRGAPLEKSALEFVCDSILLLSAQQQRRGVVNNLGVIIQLLKESGRLCLEVSDDLELYRAVEGNYILYADCFVDESSVLECLCKTLKSASFKTCPVKLAVDKLKLGAAFVHALELLQELIDVKALRGLGLLDTQPFNFAHILPFVRTFENLTSLSLPCGIDFSLMSSELLPEIEATLGGLRRLKSLDLSFARIGGRLSRLLRRTTVGLRRLNLAGCALSESDLIYLSSSPLSGGLTELDLSRNNLAGSTSSVCCILKSCPQLRSVHLANCRIGGAGAKRIFVHLADLKALQWIDFSENFIDLIIIEENLGLLRNLDNLRYVWLLSAFHDANNLGEERRRYYKTTCRHLLGYKVVICI